jgi:hypothetical protein
MKPTSAARLAPAALIMAAGIGRHEPGRAASQSASASPGGVPRFVYKGVSAVQ